MSMWKKIYVIFGYLVLGAGINAWAGDNDRTLGNGVAIDKQKVLGLVNEARAKGCNCGGKYFSPAPPLSWNNKLEMAAEKHSNFMKATNNLSHTGENGSNAGQRITLAGYKWNAYGENIAVGYANEEDVVRGWLKSAPHCKNLMNSGLKDMAVMRNGSYWTQVLASGE